MSLSDMLVNSVVVEQRSIAINTTGEEVESFIDGPTLPASVQERATRQLSLPDIDGPVIVNAVIYTAYQSPDTIKHLDRLRQVDVTPSRRYQVILPADGAGRHHHLEIACQKIEEIDAGGS